VLKRFLLSSMVDIIRFEVSINKSYIQLLFSA